MYDWFDLCGNVFRVKGRTEGHIWPNLNVQWENGSNRKSKVSNQNKRDDLNNKDLKKLGEGLKRLNTLQSINLNFQE